MFHAPRDWAIHERVMTQFVLQYVMDGYARYPVGGSDYETFRGDLLFHRPHERHSIVTVPDRPYVCVSIVFHFGHADFPYDELLEGRHLLGNYAGDPVETMLLQLVENYRQPGLDHQLRAQSLLMRILADVAPRARERREPAAADAVHLPKLVLMKHYLAEHYNRDVRLKELQDVSGLSKNYILALFRKHAGISPMQYVTHLRIAKAKELAIQSSMSVSEIALHVGYADVHTFGRMFKRKTGQSITRFCSMLVER